MTPGKKYVMIAKLNKHKVMVGLIAGHERNYYVEKKLYNFIESDFVIVHQKARNMFMANELLRKYTEKCKQLGFQTSMFYTNKKILEPLTTVKTYYYSYNE